MKKIKLTPKEVRKRSDGELETLQVQMAADLFKNRLQLATNQSENSSALKATKRELARVKTILRARQLGIEESVGGEGAEA